MKDLDSRFEQARIVASQEILRSQPPDGSPLRLRAHALLLRQPYGPPHTARASDALADIAMALVKVTFGIDKRMYEYASQQFKEMANVFEARASECLLTNDGMPINIPRATVWREAADMLRQVAAGETTQISLPSE